MTGTPNFPSLLNITPDEGFQLAIKLPRVAVKVTQPDAVVRTALREI